MPLGTNANILLLTQKMSADQAALQRGSGGISVLTANKMCPHVAQTTSKCDLSNPISNPSSMCLMSIPTCA